MKKQISQTVSIESLKSGAYVIETKVDYKDINGEMATDEDRVILKKSEAEDIAKFIKSRT
jgi:hypothetical protein